MHDWERENRNADKHFEKLMEQLKWRKCPVCSMPSERKSGSCYFLQCRSEKCRKRTYWCYVCGLQLPLEEHYKHYPEGPYKPKCLTPESHRIPLGHDQPARKSE